MPSGVPSRATGSSKPEDEEITSCSSGREGQVTKDVPSHRAFRDFCPKRETWFRPPLAEPRSHQTQGFEGPVTSEDLIAPRNFPPT